MVKHPSHYATGDSTYEPYRVIAEWGCNFNVGSAIKYLARYQKKWNPIEDLEKAKQYIDFEIERLRDVEARKSERKSSSERKSAVARAAMCEKRPTLNEPPY